MIEIRIILVQGSRAGIQFFAVVVDEGNFNGDTGGKESGHVDQEIGVLVGDGAGMGAIDGVEDARGETVFEVDGAVAEHSDRMLQPARRTHSPVARLRILDSQKLHIVQIDRTALR